MRRFSQRSALVTLSEINITPLLDLAFVLLIIFVITTPLLEKGLDLSLPKLDALPDKPIPKENVRTVEISSQGAYFIGKQQLSLAQLEANLVRDHQLNPGLVVYIRGDENCRLRDLAALLDVCQRHGITKYSLRTHPPKR